MNYIAVVIPRLWITLGKTRGYAQCSRLEGLWVGFWCLVDVLRPVFFLVWTWIVNVGLELGNWRAEGNRRSERRRSGEQRRSGRGEPGLGKCRRRGELGLGECRCSWGSGSAGGGDASWRTERRACAAIKPIEGLTVDWSLGSKPCHKVAASPINVLTAKSIAAC